MLKTLSIRTGLLSLLAVMTLLLLIVSGIGIYALTQSSSSLQRINHLQGEQMVQLNSGYTLILRARNEAGQAVRMMEIGLLDDAANAVKNINQEVALAQKTLKGVIDGGVADEEGQRLLDKVAASLATYNQQGINPMLKTLNDQSADGYYDLLEKTLIPVAKQFDNDMQAFQKWSEARGQAEVTAVQASKTRVLILIIVAALLTAGIIVLAWLALRHMLLKPLSASIVQLENVAAGDLTHTLTAPASQEFNRLNAVIEEMRHSLMNSVLRVRDASAQIDTGSRELTTSLEQTAASMEQITATVKLNADNAEQAHQLAKSVSDTADHGSEMVCYVIEKMRDISGSSARIADILSVIDGIAFQTNILALNASVEAARAGEQGRGFAVVAGEVRNLASRSADAAKEIRSLISDSQTHVNEGSELAQQAGETMDEIATEVLRMTKLMREIATASQEQSRGIEQVNIAVNQMDETAQQNAALVQESSAATRSLEEQSRQLMEAMSSFKVSAQTAA